MKRPTTQSSLLICPFQRWLSSLLGSLLKGLPTNLSVLRARSSVFW